MTLTFSPTDASGVPADHISVQERGNSIYRDSAYSNRFSAFNLGSFGRGTLTFKHQQARLNNQQRLQQQEQQPQSQDQSPVEDINLQPLQGQELQQLTGETTA